MKTRSKPGRSRASRMIATSFSASQLSANFMRIRAFARDRSRCCTYPSAASGSSADVRGRRLRGISPCGLEVFAPARSPQGRRQRGSQAITGRAQKSSSRSVSHVDELRTLPARRRRRTESRSSLPERRAPFGFSGGVAARTRLRGQPPRLAMSRFGAKPLKNHAFRNSNAARTRRVRPCGRFDLGANFCSCCCSF